MNCPMISRWLPGLRPPGFWGTNRACARRRPALEHRQRVEDRHRPLNQLGLRKKEPPPTHQGLDQLRQAGGSDAVGLFLAPGQEGPVGGLARAQDVIVVTTAWRPAAASWKTWPPLTERGPGAGGQHRGLRRAGRRGKQLKEIARQPAAYYDARSARQLAARLRSRSGPPMWFGREE